MKPARRFTDKPDLDPGSVRGLSADHPAMRGNRTLFPSTVVTVTKDDPSRLLVSGANNRKLGDVVAKGKFKGYALYGLSLEERATCPEDCAVRGQCYGNGMQMARRHRIGDPEVFFDRLGFEIAEILDEHGGLLIRLHVLGDFPSVDYVAFWADVLDEYPKVACYGYTARRTKSWGGDEIGDAIEAIKDKHPDRFRIRWSSEISRPDGAIVIDRVPRHPRIDEGLVCPAQTDATACCASCGLCWESAAKREAIVFIRHGPKSFEAAAATEREKTEDIGPEQQNAGENEAAAAPQVITPAARPIRPIDLPAKLTPPDCVQPTPDTRLVAPTDLLVELKYQRDLSGKSIKLIRSIVAKWDWRRFKPPICAETPGGLMVIDGQHTAIAAATHRGIKLIPVLVVKAAHLAERAEAFVSHNRDRLAMSALQVFHAEVAAGNKEAFDVLKIAIASGCRIPRSTPAKGSAKPGDTTGITALRRIYKQDGPEMLGRILRIAAKSEVAPIASTALYGLQILCRGKAFAEAAQHSEEAIADALRSIKNVEAESQKFGSETGQNRYRACANLIAGELNYRAERSAESEASA